MAERRRRSEARVAPTSTVGDVVAALDAIAPFASAADWDNVGLLAGRRDWPARKALIAIDLTDDVAREALRRGVDTLVCYHPPIFKGTRTIGPHADASTTLLADLLAHRVAILAVHTALDAAAGGTNDLLLDAFDVVERFPLEPVVADAADLKLVVFTPAASLERLRAALSEAGAGVIGNYAECGFSVAGRGSFRGNEHANPAIGRRGVLEHVDELRLEMVVPQTRVADVVRTLYANHPYEEPAFDLYPLRTAAGRGRIGMGRVGRLRTPTRGNALLAQLAGTVDPSGARVVGALDRAFTSVTAAAGSFGVRGFRDPTSLVVTGEFKHHDALELLKRGITALHLGHRESEEPVREYLRTELGQRVRGIAVALATADRSPFRPAAIPARAAPASNSTKSRKTPDRTRRHARTRRVGRGRA
ncbi:MAG: YqfO family protein [Phycisphaerae bacterium]